MEPPQPEIRQPQGCSRSFRACIVVVGLLTVLFLGLLVYAFRMPAVRGVVRCKSNLEAIGAALGRYNDVNGSYPRSLAEIRSEYLKDPSVLRCPLDEARAGDTSYVYHRPKSTAKDSFVILECHHHRLLRDAPPTVLVYQLGGVVKTVMQHESGTKGVRRTE